MKISVIVPVYNTEEYLRKCLDSIIMQTFKDYEIIIVDDGSQDNSAQIINEYVKKYSCIKAFKKENGGLSSARNYGIEKASGDYLLFVDSDDYIDKDMLKKMYDKAILENSDIVVSEFSYVYSNGKVVRSHSNLDYSEYFNCKYLLTPPMAPIRLFKKSLFDNIKFKVQIYYEDLDLCPKMVLYTKKISFVNESLYFYLMRDSSIMHQKKFNNHLNDIYSVLDSNYNLLYQEYPEEIEYMYIIHLLRTASLRFLDYKEGKAHLKEINKIMKERFPHWSRNKYFKLSNKKIKLICYLVYYRLYLLLKLIKKISNK